MRRVVSAGSASLLEIGWPRTFGWNGRPVARLLLGLAILLGVSACSTPSVNVVIFGDRPLQVTKRPASQPRPADGAYTVRKGDTVYGIARRYGSSIRGVIDANALKPPYLLKVGQRLTLPTPRLHTVVAGDTVNEISQHYQVAMNELVRLNDLPPPYTIIIGQKLKLPGGQPTTVASSQRQTQAKRSKTQEPTKKLLAKPRRGPALARPPSRASATFAWPIGGRVISGFGPKGKGLHNDGINISAPRGAAVKAAENGIVAYSGNELRGFGNLLLIKHSDGFMSAYAHNEKLLVKVGQKVRRGQTIARVGTTGSVVRPQLHFELRRGVRVVNPIKHLQRLRAKATPVRSIASLAVRPDPE